MANTVPSYNLVWQQGEDGEISIVYKVNDIAVDLTGYSLRMDIKVGGSGTILLTLNSADADAGGETTSGDEVLLNNLGEIYIVIPRSASLNGGPLFNHIDTALTYDMFLRDTFNKQRKILQGTITIQKSVTLWS